MQINLTPKDLALIFSAIDFATGTGKTAISFSKYLYKTKPLDVPLPQTNKELEKRLTTLNNFYSNCTPKSVLMKQHSNDEDFYYD